MFSCHLGNQENPDWIAPLLVTWLYFTKFVCPYRQGLKGNVHNTTPNVYWYLLCAKLYKNKADDTGSVIGTIYSRLKRGGMYSRMYTLHNLLSWHYYLGMLFCRSVVNRQAKIKAEPKESLNSTLPPANFPLSSSSSLG